MILKQFYLGCLAHTSYLIADEQAKQKYPNGWKAPRPYLRIVPQPK